MRMKKVSISNISADYNKSRRLIPRSKIALIYLRHFPP